MKIKTMLAIAAVVIFSACQKEDDGGSNGGGSKKLDSGVLVVNEGAFNASNATVTLFSNDDEKTDNLFRSMNDGLFVGDVLQSIGENDSYYYLVVNNSGKIEVVKKNTFKSEATITGFTSPRYFLDLGNGKALVTNLAFGPDSVPVANTIDVVNTNTNMIESSIAVDNWCEGMHLKGDKIFVANKGKNKILVYNKESLALEDEINTPEAPTQILEDKNGKLWVLCEGESWNSIEAAILRINPTSGAIEVQNDFLPGSTYPKKIAMNGGGGILFVLTDRVSKTSVNDGMSLEFIPNAENYSAAYGLGVDPESTEIYVSDAKDYTAKGMVHVYDIDGNQIKSFEAGVAPNGFVFR